VILKEVRKTIVEHDRRCKICRNGKADPANVLPNIQVGVGRVNEHPLRLRGPGGIGRREGGRDEVAGDCREVVCVRELHAVGIVYGNLLDLRLETCWSCFIPRAWSRERREGESNL